MATGLPGDPLNRLIRLREWWDRRKWWVLAVFGVLLAVAALYSDEVTAVVNRIGNWASLLGLVLGLIALVVSVGGFWLTVWTVRETQRITQETHERVRAAVEAGRQETRAAVRKIGFELAKVKCQDAYQRLLGVLASIAAHDWSRSIEKIREVQQACRQLSGQNDVLIQERRELDAGADALTKLIRYIETAKLQRTNPSPAFVKEHRDLLETLLRTLDRLDARLKTQTLEVPHATP